MASAHFSTSGVASETRWPEWGISWSSAFPATSCHFHPLYKGASVEGSTSINIEKVFVDVSLTLGNKEFCNGTLWQHISWLICEVLLQGCCQKSLHLYKCQKLDISFIKNLALPTFLPAKKKIWGITYCVPSVFHGLIWVCVCAHICMFVYMQTDYKWYAYSIYSKWVLRNCHLRGTSIMHMQKYPLIFVIKVVILWT